MLDIAFILEWFGSVSGRAVCVSMVVGMACALVGMMLVVRRQSLMGDAISHAVLPGLAIAFILSGSLGTGVMLLGALGAGLATSFMTEVLQRRGGVSADAALGVVYTSLFALGVILIKRFMQDVHFDVACVYEGSLLHAVLDTVKFNTPWGLMTVPRSLLSAGGVFLAMLACNALFWKELRLCAFDPALATTMGFSSRAMHYLVMGMVSVTAAVSFEAVGAILVVAMMIAPAATAQLLADRLAPMTLIAVLLAAFYGLVGYLLAEQWDVSPSGLIACLAGLGYAFAAVASPRHGAFARVWASMQLAWKIRRDDLLAWLYRQDERLAEDGNSETDHFLPTEDALRCIGGGFWARRTLASLSSQKLIEIENDSLKLTPAGTESAAKLVRTHRLWEKYLVEEVGIQEDHVHEPADLVEHYLDGKLEADLEAELKDTTKDPHGRTIPKRKP